MPQRTAAHRILQQRTPHRLVTVQRPPAPRTWVTHRFVSFGCGSPSLLPGHSCPNGSPHQQPSPEITRRPSPVPCPFLSLRYFARLLRSAAKAAFSSLLVLMASSIPAGSLPAVAAQAPDGHHNRCNPTHTPSHDTSGTCGAVSAARTAADDTAGSAPPNPPRR